METVSVGERGFLGFIQIMTPHSTALKASSCLVQVKQTTDFIIVPLSFRSLKSNSQ